MLQMIWYLVEKIWQLAIDTYLEHSTHDDISIVNLLTSVVDTDYENWAVFVQCMTEDGKNKFLSTRVMSRAKTLSADQWLLVKETIQVTRIHLIF